MQRAQEIASSYNIPAYDNYHQLIQEINLDAVSIVVPTSLHYEVAKTFLENNIHVLLEKPITTTIDEAEELITIAKKNNLVLQVGHLERFNPVFLAIQASQKSLQDGTELDASGLALQQQSNFASNQNAQGKRILDQPTFIETVRLAPFKPRGIDVSVILDLMIHDIDIVQQLAQSPIKSIQASGSPVVSSHIDIAEARIEFDNGCIGKLTASRISTKAKRKLRVFQHDTFLAGDLDNKTLTISRKDTNAAAANAPLIVTEELTLEKNDAILQEINAFINSIIKQTPAVVSGEDGKKALATALQITAQAMSRWQQYGKRILS